MLADLESIVCKFGGDPAICLREAICAKVYRQTDGQTTDAAPFALAHSWNGLKIPVTKHEIMLHAMSLKWLLRVS